MVGGHRRDAAPVVDAGLEQPVEGGRVEVGRRLDAHRRREKQARERDRPELILERRLRRRRHRGAGLGAEILDDDLLQVIVFGVQRAQRQQSLDALAPGLADADQDAAGEGDRELAGRADGREPNLGALVGTAMMRAAALAQSLRGRLEHQPGRYRDRAQALEIGPAHDARIDVRQQAGGLLDPPRDLGEVVDGGGVAERRQRLAGDPVALLRLVAEREQRLVAAGLSAGLGDRDRLARPTGRARSAHGVPGRRCSSGRHRGRAGSAG